MKSLYIAFILFCIGVNVACASEITKVEIFYNDFYSSTSIPLNAAAVIQHTKVEGSGSAHIILTGGEIRRVVRGIIDQKVLNARTVNDRELSEVDCRIVFRFYTDLRTFRELNVGGGLKAGWKNLDVPPPDAKQVREILSLLPLKTFLYITDAEAAAKQLSPK